MNQFAGAVPDEADVVIIGAGAAGCVLATRLSENPGCRVVVLESGTTTGREPGSRVPGLGPTLMTGDTAWPDLTAAQDALDGRQVHLAQGRGVGGGSSMNAMAWFQGRPDDYDGWAAGGAPGWAWADVQPVFERIEDDEARPNPEAPLPISRPRDVTDLSMTFVAAGQAFGLPVSTDFNGDVREGVGLFSANVRDGERQSVVDGYLNPVLGRANLTVRTGCHVTSVVFTGRRATGVTFVRDGTRGVIGTRRAVVLTAGALRSPQLLMLSGIGPAVPLRSFGIDVVHDLPAVGQNLQDHPMTTPTWPVTDGSPLRNALRPADERAYRLLRRGPLASYSQAGAMLRTRPGPPDVQATLALAARSESGQVITEPVLTVATCLLAPRSRGQLTLASADPMAAPVADPRYLSDPDDLIRMAAGLRVIRDLMNTDPMAVATGAPRTPQRWDEEGLIAWIRSNAGTEWHPAGTCRMSTEADGVVDPGSMAVHGIDGLFVADSSVMPTLTRGNIQAPVVMIAERAAERLRRLL